MVAVEQRIEVNSMQNMQVVCPNLAYNTEN